MTPHKFLPVSTAQYPRFALVQKKGQDETVVNTEVGVNASFPISSNLEMIENTISIS